jgi:hypothetical protein
MTYIKATLWGSVVAAAMIGSVYAQTPSTAQPATPATPSTSSSSTQPAASTPAPAAANASSASANSSTPAAPSEDFIKKARNEGFKPEVQKNGETLFCRKDASLGTRFETKKCLNQDQVQQVIYAAQDQRNNLRPRTCQGAGCGAQ